MEQGNAFNIILGTLVLLWFAKNLFLVLGATHFPCFAVILFFYIHNVAMLFVCLLFYRCKYRFIWRFEVFAAVGAIKSLVLLSNALKPHLRRSNGKRKVVSGLARNLIGH